MTRNHANFVAEGSGLSISARVVPWDSNVFGFPVVHIEKIELSDSESAIATYNRFRAWLKLKKIRIVSCRLGEQQLAESMFLEEKKFRFVEMVLHPIMHGLPNLRLPDDVLVIQIAGRKDIPLIQSMAERSFRYERFHVDPRLDSHLANQRYGRWIQTSDDNPRQQLLKINDCGNLVGFFLVEMMGGNQVYWHLTAIAPEYQGKGYGKRVWQAMLLHHQKQGLMVVSTTISARNVPVLNLYSQLRFRFQPPEITLHWVNV